MGSKKKGARFWAAVEVAVVELGIPHSTYRSWKHLGKTPPARAADIYNVLKGTAREIRLEDLL